MIRTLLCVSGMTSDMKVATNKTDTVSLAMGKCKRWSKKKKK